MRFGIAILRAVVGGLFIGHGLQKLKGGFGGYGLEGTGGCFEQLGLQPGKVHATAAGVAETAGGALLVAGLATPLAASALTGTMTVAIHKVHGPNGTWAPERRLRVPAVLTAALFAITASGPGALGARPPRVGHARGRSRRSARASAARRCSARSQVHDPSANAPAEAAAPALANRSLAQLERLRGVRRG